MNPLLHIVCLDAPSPPDYGGAIDMFYKVKALSRAGWRICLHYYAYRSGRSAIGLEQDCERIFSYPRKPMLASLPFSTPYIVSSRVNKQLLQRLNADDSPILLEGLHCAGLIPHIRKQDRVVLRMHNEEASYYHHLSLTEISRLKALYFRWESRLLKRYQFSMRKDIRLACLSQTDETTLKDEYGFQYTAFIPCFTPWQSLNSNAGMGMYCLYHGNLSVAENEQAAFWLITQVFQTITYPLIIAGKGVSKQLRMEAARHSNVSLVNDPSIAVIDGLVREAHINVLPSLNRTGVKLKLLNALFNGRYCITNSQGISGSGINSGVVVAEDAGTWQQVIKQLMELPFSKEQAEQRKPLLQLYNNFNNAKRLSALW